MNSQDNQKDYSKSKEKLELNHEQNVDQIFKKTGINFEKTNSSLKNFSKLINASRIIVAQKLEDIDKINSFYLEKLDKVEVSLRIRFKRNTDIIKQTINIIKAELEHMNNQYQKFFVIDVILNKLFYDMKIKFEVNYNLNSYSSNCLCFISINLIK